jgi:hypothetical protein
MDVSLDALNPDTLALILAHVDSTADLLRLGMTCRLLHDAATYVRWARIDRRRRAWASDVVGCAHQLVTAVALDDVVRMVDALDVGLVNVDDTLDVDYLCAVAVPNVIVSMRREDNSDNDDLNMAVLSAARESIGCTRWTLLGIAAIYGSSDCARVLVSLGARIDRHSADCLVHFVLTRTAWRLVETHIAQTLSPVLRRHSFWPRAGRSSCVDPVRIVGSLLRARRDDPRAQHGACLFTKRFDQLGAARRAIVQRVESLFRLGARQHCSVVLSVCIGQARDLMALLVRYGCRPHDPGVPTPETISSRWQQTIDSTRRLPLADQVRAWRIDTASTSEHEAARQHLDRICALGRDDPRQFLDDGVVAVRAVLSAIVSVYDDTHARPGALAGP